MYSLSCCLLIIKWVRKISEQGMPYPTPPQAGLLGYPLSIVSIGPPLTYGTYSALPLTYSTGATYRIICATYVAYLLFMFYQ